MNIDVFVSETTLNFLVEIESDKSCTEIYVAVLKHWIAIFINWR